MLSPPGELRLPLGRAARTVQHACPFGVHEFKELVMKK